MEEFMNYFMPFVERVMPYIATALIAVLMYVKFYLDNKRLKESLESIETQIKNSDDDYYVICPTCGSKLMLAKLKIYIERKAKEDAQDGNHN